MYLTARSYLLAGFTAASIVAAIPFAPRTTVHMPDIHAADVRLAAAESQIAATVRTLRAVEARAVASTVEGAATTVLPDLARRSAAAAAVIVPVSVAGPVVGDGVALAFDLAGTQAALMNSVSFRGRRRHCRPHRRHGGGPPPGLRLPATAQCHHR